MFDTPLIGNEDEEMNREKLIRALRKYCRKNSVFFEVDRRRGKGAHYLVTVGARRTTVQSDINENKVKTLLEQLGVDPAAL